MMLFALRNKEAGKLARFSTHSNAPAEFCCDVAYELVDWGDQVWVTTSREIAEKAANRSEEWYNAGFETPENRFVGKLEVVELKEV